MGVNRFSGNFTGFLAAGSLETPACELLPGEPVAIVNKVDPNWLNRAKLALEVVGVGAGVGGIVEMVGFTKNPEGEGGN